MDVVDAYLYIKRFLAQGTDGIVTEDEWTVMVDDLVADTAHLGLDELSWLCAMERTNAVYDAMLELGPSAPVAHFRNCVAHLKQLLAVIPEARHRLVKQLWALAEADGVVDWMEHQIITEVERAWESEFRTNPV